MTDLFWMPLLLLLQALWIVIVPLIWVVCTLVERRRRRLDADQS